MQLCSELQAGFALGRASSCFGSQNCCSVHDLAGDTMLTCVGPLQSPRQRHYNLQG